jgi:L-iditol 2-dehydrogenase
MKAAVVVEAGRIKIMELPDPEPGPYQAIVQVLACGFCNGTDMKIVEGLWPGLPGFPYILGHETVSRVAAVGSKVRHLAVGDRVLQARVEDYTKLGIGSAWGGFVEYALATDWQAMQEDGVPLPNPFFKTQQTVPTDMDVTDAVMLITMKEVYSALQSFGVPPGREVLICGDGPVGILMAFCAKTLGAGEVILSGHHDDRLALARQFGASVTINTRETALTEAVASRYPHGLPLVIDAVGHNPILQDGLDLLAPEGKIGVYGFSDRRAAMLDWSRAPVQWSLEYLVVPILERLLEAHAPLQEMILCGKVSPKEIVTHFTPLEETQQAYDLTCRREAVKAVVSVRHE